MVGFVGKAGRPRSKGATLLGCPLVLDDAAPKDCIIIHPRALERIQRQAVVDAAMRLMGCGMISGIESKRRPLKSVKR